MLGFSSGIAEGSSEYGVIEDHEVFEINDLACSGFEASLLLCPQTRKGNCLRGQAAGVTCFHGEQ